MIRTHQLIKRYDGFTALRGIDLHVEPGDIFGFIGPNGAGKTTTIKILTTLLEPSSGDATIGGRSVWDDKDAIRARIGYMPDAFGVYPDMSVTEYLHFFAAAYGIPRRERRGLVGGLLELTDLAFKEDALVDSLSKGMQQRLGLARTLVHDPEVLILDEPAAGLDPRARVEIREILRELRRMGKTILLSSHILSELEEVCSRIGIIEQGNLVAQGSVAQILEEAAAGCCVELDTTDNTRASALLLACPEIAAVHRDEGRRERLKIKLAADHRDVTVISEALHSAAIGIRHLRRDVPSLEAVFMRMTEGLVQ